MLVGKVLKIPRSVSDYKQYPDGALPAKRVSQLIRVCVKETHATRVTLSRNDERSGFLRIDLSRDAPRFAVFTR